MYDKTAQAMFSQLWRVSYSDQGEERGELWISSLHKLDKLMEPTGPRPLPTAKALVEWIAVICMETQHLIQI
jgi:hypothetical protein